MKKIDEVFSSPQGSNQAPHAWQCCAHPPDHQTVDLIEIKIFMF